MDIEKLEELDLAAVPALIKLENEGFKSSEINNAYSLKARQALIRLNSKYFGEGEYNKSPEPGSWNYSDYRGKTELKKHFK